MGVPYGNNATLGMARETSFGTFVPPTMFHSIEQIDPQPEWITQDLTGARGHQGMTPSIITGFLGNCPFTPESDSDTVAQLIALAMGAQTAPTQTIVNTTLNGATIVGATSFTLTSAKGVRVGQQLTFDTSTNMETLTVASFTGPLTITTTTAATKAHASLVAVSLTATSAYTSDLTLGVVPSFSMELNTGVRCDDFVGCKVNTLALKLQKQKGLSVQAGIVYQKQAKQLSPTAPTYSTKIVPIFENPSNVNVMGAQLLAFPGATLHDLSINLNNNLDTNYRPSGTQYVTDFPQKQRKVTAQCTLGFESDALLDDFINNGATNAKESLRAVICSTDMADSTLKVPYSFEFLLAAGVMKKHGRSIKGTDLIFQTFDILAGESVNRGNDDLRITLHNTASAAY